jgi:hypothetical protein
MMKEEEKQRYGEKRDTKKRDEREKKTLSKNLTNEGKEAHSKGKKEIQNIKERM